MLLLRLSLKNLTKHPLRLVLTGGALAVAIFLMCVLQSLGVALDIVAVRGTEEGEDRYDERRSAPSKRAGARWRSINIPEDAYFKLKEISPFYKKSMSSLMDEMVEERFNKAYEESLTLARIEANRQKARDETPDRIDPARRTHF